MEKISTMVLGFTIEVKMEAVDDEVRELFVGMLKDAKHELESFVSASKDIKYDGKVATFKQILLILGWLAEPDKTCASRITFGQCCDYLGLQKDVVMKNYKEILANAHPNGIRELKRYVGIFVSDARVQREHYKPTRRKNPA